MTLQPLTSDQASGGASTRQEAGHVSSSRGARDHKGLTSGRDTRSHPQAIRHLGQYALPHHQAMFSNKSGGPVKDIHTGQEAQGAPQARWPHRHEALPHIHAMSLKKKTGGIPRDSNPGRVPIRTHFTTKRGHPCMQSVQLGYGDIAQRPWLKSHRSHPQGCTTSQEPQRPQTPHPMRVGRRAPHQIQIPGGQSSRGTCATSTSACASDGTSARQVAGEPCAHSP